MRKHKSIGTRKIQECPFCGCSDELARLSSYIICGKCGATGPATTLSRTIEESEDAWNTRYKRGMMGALTKFSYLLQRWMSFWKP